MSLLLKLNQINYRNLPEPTKTLLTVPDHAPSHSCMCVYSVAKGAHLLWLWSSFQTLRAAVLIFTLRKCPKCVPFWGSETLCPFQEASPQKPINCCSKPSGSIFVASLPCVFWKALSSWTNILLVAILTQLNAFICAAGSTHNNRHHSMNTVPIQKFSSKSHLPTAPLWDQRVGHFWF